MPASDGLAALLDAALLRLPTAGAESWAALARSTVAVIEERERPGDDLPVVDQLIAQGQAHVAAGATSERQLAQVTRVLVQLHQLRAHLLRLAALTGADLPPALQIIERLRAEHRERSR